MAEPDAIAAAVGETPYMPLHLGRRVHALLREHGAREVLEIGTAHGTSTAWMAGAVRPAGGTVTTVDSAAEHWTDPTPQELLERAGVLDAVRFVRVEESSYNWWLAQQVAERTDAAGNCEPMFDFCYLDGSHRFEVDALAAVLIERLLRPGGWLLMDDLGWTHRRCPEAAAGLTEAERDVPHMKLVFDVIVTPHPAFTELRITDGWFGWARKDPTAPRRLTLERSEQGFDRLRSAVARRIGRRD